MQASRPESIGAAIMLLTGVTKAVRSALGSIPSAPTFAKASMANIFVTSDHHFGHANILNFVTNTTGERMRPWTDVDEMNEALIDAWNRVVRPQDKVYHLGDVAMHRKFIPLIGRCNGHKRLVRGNHDIFPTKYYLPFFEEIYATRVFDDMILSHIPLHPESVKSRWTNIHGHCHSNIPELHFGPKYLNVCVEVTNWAPLAIEEVRQLIHWQQFELTTHRSAVLSDAEVAAMGLSDTL